MMINFGAIKGKAHYFPVHVFWNSTDAGGVVYYANYLKMAEEARISMLKLFGPPPSEPGEFMVKKCTADYLRPARFDDDLEIITTCSDLKGASLVIEQDVVRGDAVLVKLSTTLVLVDLKTMKPLRISDFYINKFKEIKNEQ